MTFTIRPAVREDTPLIIGLAGPSKSGKTYSAHRLAQGLAPGGLIVMINAEGRRGHQYADRFKYHACDIHAPFSYERYLEAFEDVAKLKPDCVIIDSVSHAHDGPGGMIEQHEANLDRMAGKDYAKRDRMTWTAWIEPKARENKFIYAMIDLDIPVVLCFRAKEKMKIERGKEPVNIGYQPIASEKITFETIFSLMLPPRCKGVPDLSLSDLREPFDAMVPAGKPLDEDLGVQLAAWSKGNKQSAPGQPPASARTGQAGTAGGSPQATAALDADPAAVQEREALLIKAREWAECGVDKYREFWTGLSPKQQHQIGTVKHEELKAIAAQVPA